MFRTINILFFVFILLSLSAYATTYYVDDSGNDGNTGLSEVQAWRHIYACAAYMVAGDNCIVLPGDYIADGRTYIAFSGSSGSPITYEARPDVTVHGFTVVNFTTFSPVDYIHIKNFTITNSEASAGDAIGIAAIGNHNVYTNNTVHNITGNGVYLASLGLSNTHNVVTNNTIYNISTQVGIFIEGSDHNITYNTVYETFSGIAGFNTTNVMVANNEVHSSGDSGIGFAGVLSHNNIIEYNHVYENCQKIDDRAGINMYRVGDNNTIRYNTVHAQHDTLRDDDINYTQDPGNPGVKYGTFGIRFDGFNGYDTTPLNSTGNQVYYNKIYNENEGILIFNFMNIDVFNNVIYNSTTNSFGIYYAYEVDLESSIKNNLIYESNSSFVYAINAPDANYDYNLYYGNGTFNFNYSVSNFADWKTASGFDGNSLNVDPHFKDITTFDFNLLPSSPAINAGTDVTIDYDFAGVAVAATPNIGLYEFIDSCNCPYINYDWALNMTYSCEITTTCDIGTGNLSFTNEGIATFNANVYANNMVYPTTGQTVYLDSAARLWLG